MSPCLRPSLFLMLGLALPGRGVAAAEAPAPSVVVVTSAPGLTAAAVATAVTERVERWVGQAAGVRRVESRSLAGLSVVTVSFRPGTDRGEALQATNTFALGAMPTLPRGTLPPLVLPAGPTELVGLLAVEAPRLDEAALTALTRVEVRSRLAGLPGVLAPGLLGGRDRFIRVELDAKRLQARDLSPLDVIRAVTDAGLKPAPGGRALLFDADRPAVSVKEVNDLPVRKMPGGPVFIRDVGQAEEVTVARQSSARLDGRRLVCLPVYAARGADLQAARAAVPKSLTALRKGLPEGTHLDFQLLDGPLLTVRVRAPSGLRLEAVEKRVAEVERFLADSILAEERTLIFSESGLNADWSALFSRHAGEQDATVRVRLSGRGKLSAADYAVKLRRLAAEGGRFADLRLSFAAQGAPAVEARVLGGAREQGARLAEQVRRRLAGVAGAADVQVMERQDEPVLVVTVDRAKAAAVGLTVGDVAAQVAAALNVALDGGRPVEAEGALTLRLAQLPEALVGKWDDALSGVAVVGTRLERPVSLAELVKLRRDVTPAEITHIDRARAVTVRAEVEGRDAGDVARDVREAVKGLPVPEGLRIEVEAVPAPDR
jgi:multidrug efflux pump subunit AcrB